MNRVFVIKSNNNKYIREIYENSIGFFYITTQKLERAKTWKYKKNCEKTIAKIINRPVLTKYINIELKEITDNQLLRKIKLNKLKSGRSYLHRRI